MLRLRTIVVAIGRAIALGAVLPGVAGAHSFFVEKKELKAASENQKLASILLSSKLKGTINGVPIEITCTATKLEEGTLEKAGESKLKIKFAVCFMKKTETGKPQELMSHCEVKEPFTWNVKDLLATVGGSVADEWRPETGAIFAKVELKGTGVGENCELPSGSGETAEGSYNIEGVEICEIVNPTEENKKHNFICVATNKMLLFGGREGGYSGTFEVALASGDEYSAH